MANANGQANTITLKAGTYTLTATNNDTDGANGLPAITSVLTIKGTSAATSILERDTSAPAFRILNVEAAGTLTLQRLTLRNNGGLFFSGPAMGGGIFNSGTLTLIDCTLANNFADFGGGLFNNNGTVTISHTTFDGNLARRSGGGLANGFSFPPFFDAEGGTVTIANSTFVHNIADRDGGIVNSNMGTMTLTNTTVAQNDGRNGGSGGILNNNGIVLLQSTTVAENLASGFGLGGGITNLNGIVLLQNTIIARNEGGPFGTFPVDCSGPVTSLGNNLTGVCSGITPQPTDLTGDPGLGTFMDNGAPGNGHFPLLSTSQAIDAGNNAVCFRGTNWGGCVCVPVTSGRFHSEIRTTVGTKRRMTFLPRSKA